jgi:pimeloyl-ACP methyl ester carboxylesterase
MRGSFPAGQRPIPEVAGVRHRFIEANGVRVHIAESGRGEPVLLLHSFPQHWYTWRGVLPHLADEYRLICPDFPGSGWSGPSQGGYDTGQRAAAVLGIMDALEIPRVRLIGHAWGAVAGFRLCLVSPDRASHFLALNATHPWPPRRAAVVNAWRQWHTAFWEYPGLGRQVLQHWPAFTRFMFRHWVVDSSSLPPEALTEFVESSREREHALAGEKLNWGYVRHDIPDLLLNRWRDQRLTVPTVILAGSRDVVIPPALCRGGAGHADDLTLVVAPDASHLLPEERPALIARVARELFAR